MSECKKARPDTAIPEREKMGAETGQATTSISHDTTAAESRQMRIADLLPVGEQNVVPLHHIRQMIDIPGREIRRMIQMEREQRIPIVSDCNGYYLAGTEQERDRFVRGMKHRAAEIIKVADAVKKAVID